MMTGSCISVLTKRVVTTFTSSTSPFKKSSRANAAMALASGNVGESP